MTETSEPKSSPIATILIVEDSAVLVTQISRALKAEYPSARVLIARSLSEGQVLAAEYPADLYLLDIHLPDGTGIDLLCDIQTANEHAKVIIMTAVPLPEYREHAHALGVLDFIEKPLNLPALVHDIGKALHLLPAAPTQAPEPVPTMPSSFNASLSCLTPVDIIQLKCLGRSTQVVEFIHSDGRTGRIFFQSGEIIDARTEKLYGVVALNEIVSWRGGRVIEVSDAPAPEATISDHWQYLLMNAVQLLDEQMLPLAS